MHYRSHSDETLLRRKSMGPALAVSRRAYALPIPGRGTGSYAARSTLRGFGASQFEPPVGAGAGAGAEIGASQGAAIGTKIVPGIGTAIGAVIGAIGGAIAGSINKKDPEQYNFDAAVALWNQNPDSVYSIGNKYLPLAGLFDLNIKTNIPIYKHFGHMGEEAFANWLVQTLYGAVRSGQIGPHDTAITVFNNVIQPIISSWGYGAMQDPHADLINRLMIGMINDWFNGNWHNWNARGGDFPNSFRSLPDFPGFAAQPQVTASPTPSPVSATPQQSTVQYVNPVMHDSNAVLVTPIGNFASTYGGSFLFSPPGIAVQTQVALSPGHTGGVGTLQIYWDGHQAIATNSDGQKYSFDTGTLKWTPYPPPSVAAPSPAPAPTPMMGSKLTPPAVGTAITQAPDAVTGAPVSLPPGGFFQGTATNGDAWVVRYPTGPNAGDYTVQNGVMTPYNASPVVKTPAALPGTQPAPVPTSPAPAPITTTTSSGGGGGGGFNPAFDIGPGSAPSTSMAPPPQAQTGGMSFDPMTLLLVGGALLLLTRR